jgi:hypothetical protein
MLRALPKDKRRNQGPWSKLFSFVALATAFVLTVLLLELIIPPTLVPITSVRAVIALAGCVALIQAGKKYKEARERGSFDPIRSAIGASIALVVLFGLSAVTGYHSAAYIMHGQPLPCPCVSFFGYNITLPWSSGTNGFLGIKAEKARVTWIGPGRSVVPALAILLGGSNGSIVLFDAYTQKVVIVPGSDVIVKPSSNLTGWNEP